MQRISADTLNKADEFYHSIVTNTSFFLHKLTKHCEFKTTYYYTEPKEREDYKVKNVNRVQVDLKYKF